MQATKSVNTKIFGKPPKTPFHRNGTDVVLASPTQIVALAAFYNDQFVEAACQFGPKEGYPVRTSIDANKKCVVIPAGKFARINTGLIVDQPIANWSQSSCLDSQAAISKVAVERGEVIAYVTGVGQDVTIYEGSWLVLVRLGPAK
jgi:hypothetical protein